MSLYLVTLALGLATFAAHGAFQWHSGYREGRIDGRLESEAEFEAAVQMLAGEVPEVPLPSVVNG